MPGFHFLLLCALTLTPARAEVTWRNLGPGGGGWIQSICASPHDVNELFVGCDVGGFYRSTDGGDSYTIQNAGLRDYWVECIVPHPTNPDIVYLGCESGVYKSVDHGRTWTWLREGFPPKQRYRWSAPIGALTIDPRSPEVLYAGIGIPRRHAFGKGTIYKTRDGGRHWTVVNQPGSLPADALVSDLLLDPRDSRHLYLACQYGVYQSRDGGATWVATISGLPQPHARRLAQCRTHPEVLYLTLESPPGREPWQGGVYRSDDGGNTWRPRCQGLKQYVGKPGQPAPMTANYDRIVCHPTNPDVAYVGGASWVNATLYKTTDGGKTWQEVVRRGTEGNFDPGWLVMWGPAVKCLTLSPLNPNLLYFGTSGGVFKTTDAGGHWTPAYTHVLPDGRIRGSGLEVTCVQTIAVHPKDPRRLYFGYSDIGLLVSDDRGETFRRCVEGIVPREVRNSCMAVAFDPANGDHCWAGWGAWSSNQGVVAESFDGGTTWRVTGTPETGLPNARHRVLLVDASSPADRCRLLTTCDGKGVYVSDDGGRTWSSRNNGLPHGDIRGLAAHPTRPGVYWCVLGDDGSRPAAVFRSDDNAATWRQVSRNLAVADVRNLIVAPTAPNRLYLAARDRRLRTTTYPGGVYRSDDGGRTWRRILDDDFVQGLAVDPRDADTIYAGLTDHPYHDESTGDGIVVSHDGGQSWSNLSGATLTCKRVNCITIDAHDPAVVYVGAGGNGVFAARIPRQKRAGR